jgi:hypothetical protein
MGDPCQDSEQNFLKFSTVYQLELGLISVNLIQDLTWSVIIEGFFCLLACFCLGSTGV